MKTQRWFILSLLIFSAIISCKKEESKPDSNSDAGTIALPDIIMNKAESYDTSLHTYSYWVSSINKDGSGLTNLSQFAGGPEALNLDPKWSPDGSCIMYTGKSDEDNPGTLYNLNISNKKVSKIADNVWNAYWRM